jgi:hypothetical protein
MKLALLLALGLNLLVPGKAAARITVDYQRYPGNPKKESPAGRRDMAVLREALFTFAGMFPKHPVNRYLLDDNPAEIVFANSLLHDTQEAASRGRTVYLKTGQNALYYTQEIAHEFIHVYFYELYGSTGKWTGFLEPADKAFLVMLEEALCNTWAQWARAAQARFPREYHPGLNPDHYYLERNKAFDAIEGNIRKRNPGKSDDEYMIMAGRTFFRSMFGMVGRSYSMGSIPDTMKIAYTQRNYLANPYYQVYRDNSHIIARDMFDTVISLLPFTLDPREDLTFFQDQFAVYTAHTASLAPAPQNSIEYWKAQPLRSQMLQKLRDNPNAAWDYANEEETVIPLNRLLERHGVNVPKRPHPARHYDPGISHRIKKNHPNYFNLDGSGFSTF